MSVDVKTAFLYEKLDEKLYMEQPEGFKVKGKEYKVLRLMHAIYGLKQAPLQWWKVLDESMAKLGFKHLYLDAGIFTHFNKDGCIDVIAVVYIDDSIFLGPNKSKVLAAKSAFMKLWECHNLGETKEFLCMCIHWLNGLITIDQSDYLNKVLQCFRMQDAKGTLMPLPQGYIPTPNDQPVDETVWHKFQQVIGSLPYLMLRTCPDILFAVTKLSQQAANPSNDHLQKALYICHYLMGTKDYMLTYTRKQDGGLCTFVDTYWASDSQTCWSTTGFMMMLAGGIVFWNTHAQKTVAMSSTEAEYMSLSDRCRQLVWTNSLLKELHLDLAPLPLCSDNQGSIFIAQNAVTEKSSKHIDVCYHYIWEVITSGLIELYFIDGQENTADMFTKNLGHVKFHYHQSQLELEFYSLPISDA